MSILKFSAKAYSENATKTIVEARNFKIIIDEPPSLGGTDDGANPVEYVLAALAGCLNVIGHVVAKEMGFELKGIEFRAEGTLDPSKFLGKSTDQRAGYQEINMVLRPDADVSRTILDEWLNIMKSRCPVSDNLSNETPVRLFLDDNATCSCC